MRSLTSYHLSIYLHYLSKIPLALEMAPKAEMKLAEKKPPVEKAPTQKNALELPLIEKNQALKQHYYESKQRKYKPISGSELGEFLSCPLTGH